MKKFRSILKLFNKIEKIEIQKSEKTNEQTTMFFMHNFFLYQAPFVEGKENSDAQKLFFFKKKIDLSFGFFDVSFILVLISCCCVFVQGKNRISSCTK